MPSVDPIDVALRPKTLADFAGQPAVTSNLRVAVDAAKARGEAMDHVLLYGAGGLGKTSLSWIIGNELGVNTVVTSGPNLRNGYQLTSMLRSLKDFDVLFIDEIHAMERSVEEYFYSALEDYRLDISRHHSVNIPKFTCVGATTQPGRLTPSLRDRFRILLSLELYGLDYMVLIVKRSAGLLQFEISDPAATDIAVCSRGIPRTANNLLRRVRDYAQVHSGGKADEVIARAALDLYGIDKFGLNQNDRAIIEVLTDRFEGRPVGLKTLASATNLDERTIELICEPHLIKLGLLDRMPRGRQATGLAYDYRRGAMPIPSPKQRSSQG